MAGPRAVRVVTEVAAVDRPFDYLVPEHLASLGIGDRVRVDFNHRSVRAWVVGEATPEPDLKPIAKWLGYGPPAEMLEFLSWASDRWLAPLARFLVSASPTRLVTSLPPAPPARALSAAITGRLVEFAPGVVQLSPTTDPLDLVLSAYRAVQSTPGSLLVVAPTDAWARRLRGRLEQRGCEVAGTDQWDRMRAGWPIVVGARGAAMAPVPHVSGAVVLDVDDESLRSDSVPTWHAYDVLAERCRREGRPLWASSMFPSPRFLLGSWYRGGDIAGGWPRLAVVDRRGGDPHDGLLARETLDDVHRALAGNEPVAVVVVHQRLGRGRLLACAQCHELYRCSVCTQAEEEVDDAVACASAHEPRERFCRSCGSTRVKRLRQGVSTVQRDLEAQLGQRISVVTAADPLDVELARVVVGTEAVFQRVRRASLVVIDDFDQYLLAARESARRQAVGVVGRAGRLVGARREGRGHVVAQTRRGEDPVLRALAEGSFEELLDEELETARVLGLSPFGATASLRGDGADDFAAALDGSRVRVSTGAGGVVVRAPDVETLLTALRAPTRPPSLRIAVE